ncbi:MAG: hypothetical protein J5880_03925 [Bacilli bacterium]|nr:hypothetical protein [Bacilli bacterium]MBO4682231.1 hypothetical protein [Bacilli bacterium]
MKQLGKVYNLFSERLSKWFIFAGIVCLALDVLIGFIGDIAGWPEEALYYILVFICEGAIVAGLAIGHYRNKEPILVVAFLTFLILTFFRVALNSPLGMSVLGNAEAPYVLNWVFSLIYGLALGCFLITVLLVYLFKLKKANIVLEISYLASLALGLLAWIFGIVAAASGYAWTNAVLPLLQVGSLLMIPGLLEELFPGELDGAKEAE